MSCRILREQCAKIQSKEPNRLSLKQGGGGEPERPKEEGYTSSKVFKESRAQ